MKNEEAKFILSAYRPNGQDANDATFSAALEQARTDPALGKWFELEQKFDRAMTAKLGSVLPPDGLRAAILTGSRVSGEGQARAWWHQPKWLALAAGVLVLLSVGAMLWPKPANASAPLLAFVADDAVHSETHGGHGASTDQLQASLAEPNVKLDRNLPVDFEALRAAGCRTVSFAGHDVLEVCFNRDGKWFHCYVVRRADFSTLVASTTPVITQQGQVSLATWGDASHAFIVVSKVGTDALRNLL